MRPGGTLAPFIQSLARALFGIRRTRPASGREEETACAAARRNALVVRGGDCCWLSLPMMAFVRGFVASPIGTCKTSEEFGRWGARKVK